MIKKIVLVLICCLTIIYVQSQVSLVNPGNTVTIDFSGFNGTGFNSTPGPGQLSSTDWDITGFTTTYTYGGNNSSGDYARGTTNGGVLSGGIYSYDDGNRNCLWIQPTTMDFTPGSMTLYLENNTGDTVYFMDISYDVIYVNNQSFSNSFAFSYSNDNSNYTQLPALKVISPLLPDFSDVTTNRSTTLTGLNIAPGGFFYLRWTGDAVSGVGLMDEFGLDNIQITIPSTNPKPTVSFSTVSSSLVEGNSSVTLLAEIDFANPDPATVDVVINPLSTATSSLDFNLITNTITFPPNSTSSQLILIDIFEDVVVEGVEYIVIEMTNPSPNVILKDSIYTISIIDNENLSIQFTGFDFSVGEDIGQLVFGVEIDNAPLASCSVDVKLKSQSSTATNSVDFLFADTTLVFNPAIDTTLYIQVDIIDDMEFEFDETIEFVLRNFTFGAASLDSSLVIAINDNDAVQQGYCTNLFFSEYIEGSNNNKAIELYNPSSQAVDLSKYSILRFNSMDAAADEILNLNGILDPGSTYVIANDSASPTILGKADLTSAITSFNGDDALILVHLMDTIDMIGDIDEGINWPVGSGSTSNFTLVRNKGILEGTSDWSIGEDQWDIYPSDFSDSLGSHTTIDCDGPVILGFSQEYIIIEESDGELFIEILIYKPDTIPAFVDLLLDPNQTTAIEGTDFIFTDSTFTFSAGSHNHGICRIPFPDDLIRENDSQICLKLANPSPNAIVEDSVLIIYIKDDDLLVLSILQSDTVLNEDDGSFDIHLKLTGLNSDTIETKLILLQGSDINNMDIAFSDTILQFLPMDSNERSFTISILDDTVVETDESFIISFISDDTLFTSNHFQITIIDNDGTINNLEEADLESELVMFPNPITKNSISISHSSGILRTDIYNHQGESVFSREFANRTNIKLDLSDLNPGMYLIRFYMNEGNTVDKKILKF